MKKSLIAVLLVSSFSLITYAESKNFSGLESAPPAPIEPQNPGSKSYFFDFEVKKVNCQGRSVSAYLPKAEAGKKFPVVVYGHGQALNLENYSATLEHLAKKGIGALFPTYDTGFFDQDWQRMGNDYAKMAACAISQFSDRLDADKVVFAGHSKGAYVASIAAGNAVRNNLPIRAKSVVLFEVAGFDEDAIAAIEPTTSLTVVFSDHDTVVKRDLSESVYATAKSHIKQFIDFKSYSDANLVADHFWPLTKSSFFGGGDESAFHYYGEWKWLTAAARDLAEGAKSSDPYLYGDLAADKGVSGFRDDIKRSW